MLEIIESVCTFFMTFGGGLMIFGGTLMLDGFLVWLIVRALM